MRRRSRHVRSTTGPTGFALACLALAALLAHGSGLAAQTPLAVVADGFDAEWAERVGELESALRWSHGPVRVLVDGAPAPDAAAVVVGLRLSDEPVDAPSSAVGRRSSVVRRAGGTPVVWPYGAPVAEVARSVEREAEAMLRAQVDAGVRALPEPTGPVYHLRGLSVTATREPRELFATPVPVTVLGGDARRITLAAAPADLFRDVPGLDVEGVGANQRRPVVRGQRGQRVLLLADGLRLNNPRRRIDSGEPLGLVGPGAVDRIEVVRGPASVLYGSDAIGGVINLVTRPLPFGTGPALSGAAHLGWGSAGDRAVADAGVAARAGPVALRVAVGYRDSDAYRAPAGRFGELSLADGARVMDSGGRDRSMSIEAGYRPGPRHEVYARYRGSDADDAGFGWVEPSLFGTGLPRVQILFPEQRFRRQVVGWRGHDLGLAPADRLELSAYRQTNDRHFVTDVLVPFGAGFPPGSHMGIRTESRTGLTSDGFRLEARKRLRGGILLTYGLDLHRDRSENSDTSTTSLVIGGGAPRVSGAARSPVPAATLRSAGAFAQTRLELGDATELLLGVRYQDVQAAAEDEGSMARTAHDRTWVGAANVLHRPADRLALIASVGRAFRSPNLVERFYSGATPEGRGIWLRNPELGPETSLNLELGARWRGGPLEVETFVFRNLIRDGIRLEATGDTADAGPVYRNVNVDALRMRGIELGAVVRPGAGFTLTGSYTWLDSEDRLEPERPVTESYGAKLTGGVRWATALDRTWTEYTVRWQGARDDVVLVNSYVGERIPGFTVHALRAGLRLPGSQRLTVGVQNLFDTLYAESLNVGFFRPEPGRRVELGLSVGF